MQNIWKIVKRCWPDLRETGVGWVEAEYENMFTLRYDIDNLIPADIILMNEPSYFLSKVFLQARKKPNPISKPTVWLHQILDSKMKLLFRKHLFEVRPKLSFQGEIFPLLNSVPL